MPNIVMRNLGIAREMLSVMLKVCENKMTGRGKAHATAGNRSPTAEDNCHVLGCSDPTRYTVTKMAQ